MLGYLFNYLSTIYSCEKLKVLLINTYVGINHENKIIRNYIDNKIWEIKSSAKSGADDIFYLGKLVSNKHVFKSQVLAFIIFRNCHKVLITRLIYNTADRRKAVGQCVLQFLKSFNNYLKNFVTMVDSL